MEPALKDIFNWDVGNWSRALQTWEPYTEKLPGDASCLELGCHQGGLSLWLASKGFRVLCTDVEHPGKQALPVHRKHHCAERIRYEALNALDIPYKESFDLVIFKSVLGGIAGRGEPDLIGKVTEQINRCLKPGGLLLFAENLKASHLHAFMRRHFVSWGKDWYYLDPFRMDHYFKGMELLEYHTFGFLGAFGRNERQRNILGSVDRLLDRTLPSGCHYIVAAAVRKSPMAN